MVEKLEKLKVLIKHLEEHNEEHAKEITGLAQTAKELGRQDVHDLLLKSAEELRTSNVSLAEAFALLTK